MESELHPLVLCAGCFLEREGMQGERVRRGVTWETERLPGVESRVLLGQMGASRTQDEQDVPGRCSQPGSGSLISPPDSARTM